MLGLKKLRKNGWLKRIEEDPSVYLHSETRSKLDQYLTTKRHQHIPEFDILACWNNNTIKYIIFGLIAQIFNIISYRLIQLIFTILA